MELHQVRYFLALCETLNFTRAAERCDVAQPSLTRAIRKLEEELGGPLFRRERNRTHLTELGRLMRAHLATMQAASEAAHAEARDFHNLVKAPLRLGIMCTIGPTRIVGFLQELGDRVANLELTLREAPCEVLVAELMSGALDVGFLALPALPERIDARPLYRENYVVACPPGHRFEAMNAVPLRELEGEDYLQRVHCEFPAHFRALGIPRPYEEVRIRYRSEREDWIQMMLLAGMGCSVMPEFLPTLPGIATRLLVEPQVSREVTLATVSGRRFSPAVALVVALAQRHPWRTRAVAPALQLVR
jgi:DNA-binding transcriptional LysR family regulator